MGIPGRKLDRVETRAKVRIGEKRQAKSGKDYPAALDYFVSDDAEFVALGKEPKQIRIVLPFATADENFSTGLERWVKNKSGSGQTLTCYTHDDGPRPIALRLTDFVTEQDEVRGEARGQRTPITCTADDCAFFKAKTCKPMGRLQFFLEEGRTDSALQLDTKSWNTIEQVAGTLKAAQRSGPLNVPGRVFVLSVAFVKKGADRFPVVSIQEDNVPLDTRSEADVDLGELLVQGDQALKVGDPDAMRRALAAILDVIRPGWRDDSAYVERIKEVGVVRALTGTLEATAAKLGPQS